VAELVLKIGDQLGDNPARYRDGHICHVQFAGFTNDGLRPNGCLAERMLQRTRQYRAERISLKEIKRITLATMDEEILSDKPNAKGEYIHVQSYIDRRTAHPRHKIFGELDREVWYGGRTYYENQRMTLVWSDIETYSAHREVDYPRWPAGSDDLKVHLFIAVDDFSDGEAEEFVASLIDEASLEPDKPVLKRRKHYVNWKVSVASSLSSSIGSIKNPALSVDVRGDHTFNKNVLVLTKVN